MKEKEIRSIFSFNLEKKRDKLKTISQLQISEKEFATSYSEILSEC